MLALEAALQANMPRVVVEYQRNDKGKDQFRWGVVGACPILTLVGYLTRLQAELAAHYPELPRHCNQPALIVVWDGNDFCWFIDPLIPTDPLIGMLEKIKATLVGALLAEDMKQAMTGLVGPNGRPIIKR